MRDAVGAFAPLDSDLLDILHFFEFGQYRIKRCRSDAKSPVCRALQKSSNLHAAHRTPAQRQQDIEHRFRQIFKRSARHIIPPLRSGSNIVTRYRLTILYNDIAALSRKKRSALLRTAEETWLLFAGVFAEMKARLGARNEPSDVAAVHEKHQQARENAERNENRVARKDRRHCRDGD